MSRTLKPIAPIRDPQMDKMVRDLYARVGRLEPEVKRLGQKVVGVSQEVARIASERGLVWDTFSEKDPKAKIGDAVHIGDNDSYLYRANLLTRNHVIGVKEGSGRIVTSGIARNVAGNLHPGSDYFLTISNAAIGNIQYADSVNKDLAIRYDTTTYAQSQSFTTTEGGSIKEITLQLKGVGSPTKSLYLEIRSDDGSGKPSTTVLTTSDRILMSDLLTGYATVYFVFSNPYYLNATTKYHFCIQSDTTDVSSSNYTMVGGIEAGAYTGGNRCYQGSNFSWTSDATDDLWFNVAYYLVDDTTGSNISVTHPFDSLDVLPILTGKIVKVGKALNTTDLNVQVENLPILLLLRDYTNVISVTGTTFTSKKFADVDCFGCSKIFILFKKKVTPSYVIYFNGPVWSGDRDPTVSGTGATSFAENGLTVNLSHRVVNSSPAGVNSLGFEFYTNNAGATGTIGMVTVIGV